MIWSLKSLRTLETVKWRSDMATKTIRVTIEEVTNSGTLNETKRMVGLFETEWDKEDEDVYRE